MWGSLGLHPFSGEWLSRSSVSLPCVGCQYRVNLNALGILGVQLSYDAAGLRCTLNSGSSLCAQTMCQPLSSGRSGIVSALDPLVRQWTAVRKGSVNVDSRSTDLECDFGPRAHSQIRRDYPLNLSISLSGGKETNQDSPSNGE